MTATLIRISASNTRLRSIGLTPFAARLFSRLKAATHLRHQDRCRPSAPTSALERTNDGRPWHVRSSDRRDRVRGHAAGEARPKPLLRRDVANADNEGWSVYGAERSQRVATSGKSGSCEIGSGTQVPLPWVATGCLSCSMVRVHSLRVMERVTFLAPQREVKSRQLEGSQDSSRL
jgi:hypothetical protein